MLKSEFVEAVRKAVSRLEQESDTSDEVMLCLEDWQEELAEFLEDA